MGRLELELDWLHWEDSGEIDGLLAWPDIIIVSRDDSAEYYSIAIHDPFAGG